MSRPDLSRRGMRPAVQPSGRWRDLTPVERLGVLVAVAIWFTVALVTALDVWRAR